MTGHRLYINIEIVVVRTIAQLLILSQHELHCITYEPLFSDKRGECNGNAIRIEINMHFRVRNRDFIREFVINRCKPDEMAMLKMQCSLPQSMLQHFSFHKFMIVPIAFGQHFNQMLSIAKDCCTQFICTHRYISAFQHFSMS